MDSESTLDASRLRALIDAGRLVLGERELESVLDRVVEVARELTGARHAAIEDHPRGRGETFLGVPILIGGEAWRHLYLTDKPGAPFDAADEETAVVLAAWASIAVENARLFDQSELRSVQLDRSVRAMRATLEIGRAVGDETRLDRVLELIAQRSRALVDASGMAIVVVDGPEVVVAATAGDVPRRILGQRATGRRLDRRARGRDRSLGAGQPGLAVPALRAPRPRRAGDLGAVRPAHVPAPVRRGARGLRPSRRSRVRRRGRARAGVGRHQRGDRCRHRADRRARPSATDAARRRGRAPPVGAGAARRDPAGPGRPAGPVGGRAEFRRTRRPCTGRSTTPRTRSPSRSTTCGR